MPRLDLMFPVHGKSVPVDHGYSLYAAISRLLETPENKWLHESDNVGLHLIRGQYLGQGSLALGPRARFGVRISPDLIHRFLPLAGKTIDLGREVLRIGIPQPYALRPATTLYAHLVTTRNGQDEKRFDDEAARQLEGLGISGTLERRSRRTFRVKDKAVVAYSLAVGQLSADDSILLQEEGLGGRRKMGCGVFFPVE